jgi:ribosomal protein S18
MKKIQLIFPLILFLWSCSTATETQSEAQTVDTTQQSTAIMDTNKGTNAPVLTENPVDLTQTPIVNNTTNTPAKSPTSVVPKPGEVSVTKASPVTSTNPPIINPTSNPTSIVAKATPVEAPTTVSVRNPPPRPNMAEATPKTTETPKATANVPQKPALSHAVFNDLLKKYVTSTGKVDYKGLKNDKAKLQEYLTILEANPPQSSWDKNKQLAFWINVYNANTIKLIVDNYPTESINKVAAKPWDKPIAKIGDKTYTLNQIENEIIRPTFKEPRIHFAVNCAAKSCPRLLNEAFAPEKLESQLEKMAKAFVNNKEANTLEEKKVELSNIFNWYKADFDASGGVIAFINKYSDIKIKDNAKISYKDYNWNLNE